MSNKKSTSAYKLFRLAFHITIYSLADKLSAKLPLWYRRYASKFLTNYYANSVSSRPTSYSLAHTPPHSWPTTTNKDYFARHLPMRVNFNRKLNSNPNSSIENVTALFARPNLDLRGGSVSQFREGRSNVFFVFFAQWFTDGFFRSSLLDPRKTGANHNVDLCQIYGLDKESTAALRLGQKGYLRSQGQLNNELPEQLFKEINGQHELNSNFDSLEYLKKFSKQEQSQSGQRIAKNVLELAIKNILKVESKADFQQAYQRLKPELLAAGLERGNATIGNLAMNTLFLRCHNRICDDLSRLEAFQTDGEANDEKIFEAARSINIVLLIKYTIEEYINHLAGRKLFVFDPSYAEKQAWYRPPWLAAEFNLLYRWHGLVPDTFHIDSENKADLRESPSTLLKTHGLGSLIKAACEQPAGSIQAGNTPSFLLEADRKMVQLGRDWSLASYNDYRREFGLKPLKTIDQLTSSPRLRAALKDIYTDIDHVEFIAGIYCEKQQPGQESGKLMTQMVAYDAFTQLYTNPLVSKENYAKLMENPVAEQWIDQTNSLDQLVSKILGEKPEPSISFTNPRFRGEIPCQQTSPIIDKKSPSYTLLNKGMDKSIYANTLCPHLRIGLRTQGLTPDTDGWVDRQQLESFLCKSGIKRHSLLLWVLSMGGRKNSPKNSAKQIKINGFKGTLLDHGSSSSILNSNKGLDLTRLSVFERFSSKVGQETRLYTDNFAQIAHALHDEPSNFKASWLGQYLQLLEFKIILEVYGRQDQDRNEKYLNYDDILRIWKRGQAPIGWQYPMKSTLGIRWTIKELISAFKQLKKNKYN